MITLIDKDVERYEQLRQQLRVAIMDAVKAWNVSQIKAAEKLEITRPVLNRIINNNDRLVSLGTLIIIAMRAGLSLQLLIGEEVEEASPTSM